LSQSGHAPAAIINTEAESIIATGAIIGKIPMIDHIEISMDRLRNGVHVVVDGEAGEMMYDGELV